MVSMSKILMTHIWRFQQVGGLVTVTLMCLNLAVLIYGFSYWRFKIIGLGVEYDWLIFIIIFSAAFLIALGFGFAYDKVFKLWRQREIVGVERNPYMKGRIKAQELVSWQYVFIPLLLKNGLKAEAEFNLKWNERNMDYDPELRKDVFKVMEWIKAYEIKDMDKQWIEDVSQITEKKYKNKYGKIKPDW